MAEEELHGLSVEELLKRTQTNVTGDNFEAMEAARLASLNTTNLKDIGVAARQRAIRAALAGFSMDIVQGWLDISREAFRSDDPKMKRETIATDLLEGRAYAHRIETAGAIGEMAIKARNGFTAAENTLSEQHKFGSRWDRFGTMNSRHFSTFESMNGSGVKGASLAIKGTWRAIRAQKEGTPESHLAFVKKQLLVNAAAGFLAVSKLANKLPQVADKRHQFALWLLGGK